MAITKLVPQKINRNSITVVDDLVYTAVSFSDGAAVDMHDDSRLVIYCHNTGSASADVVVRSGNALQTTGQDLLKTIPAGKVALITVESGLFGNLEGELRGKLHIDVGSANVKACAVLMPQ